MLKKKIVIISLPTLPLDKFSIIKTIDILKKYLIKLGIKDVAIINKLFIFKRDFFNM